MMVRLTRLGMLAALCAAPVAAAWAADEEGPSRFEIAAREFVDGCEDADKVMTHIQELDKMPTNDMVVQVWTGACKGAEAEAVTIVCAAPLLATRKPQCFIKN
tara:strand:+ start:214 stop:522 length:309 start_codon:yes stop_codon:yes gene_type:complete